MNKEEIEFYKDKFNNLIKKSVILDPESTQEIITLDTIESIIKDQDIFNRFLNFEDNLDFFNTRIDGLQTFLIGINAYITYSLENGTSFSNDQLERIQILTGKQPELSNVDDSKRKQQINSITLEILQDETKLSKLLNMPDTGTIEGISVKEIIDYISNSKGLKELIDNYYFNSVIEKNYKTIQDIIELKRDYDKLSPDFKIDEDFENMISSEIEKRIKFSGNIDKTVLARRIVLEIRKAMIKSEKRDLLAKDWENIVAFFLEKYNIDTYIKKSDDDKDVKVLNGLNVESIKKPFELDEEKRKKKFQEELENVKKYYYRFQSEKKMNPEFENLIINSAKYSDDKYVYAFNLYEALNRKLTFSPVMSALKQDLNNPLIEELYYRGIDKFDENNNALTCRGWAEMYAYLIEKYIGGEAYLNKYQKHKKVQAAIDGVIITADATNITVSETESHSFSDLTRAKLHLRPSGFSTNISVPSLELRMMDYQDLDEEKFQSDFINYEQKQDVMEFMELVGNPNLADETLKLSEDSELENIIKKLKFISDVAKNENMPNTDTIKYLRVLKNIILDNDERKKVSLFNTLYTEIREKNNVPTCEIVPVFTIDVSSEDSEEQKYFYLIYDSKNGLCRASKEQIMDLIVAKKFNVIDNGKDYISGMLEIYSETEMAEYSLQKKGEHNLGEQGDDARL